MPIILELGRWRHGKNRLRAILGHRRNTGKAGIQETLLQKNKKEKEWINKGRVNSVLGYMLIFVEKLSIIKATSIFFYLKTHELSLFSWFGFGIAESWRSRHFTLGCAFVSLHSRPALPKQLRKSYKQSQLCCLCGRLLLQHIVCSGISVT